jgi:hypothetical protein
LTSLAAITVGILLLGSIYIATDGFGAFKPNPNAVKNGDAIIGGEDVPMTADAATARKLIADASEGKYDIKCTYKTQDMNGLLYLRNKKQLRFDTQKKNTILHALKTGRNLYLWDNSGQQGLVIQVELPTDGAAETQVQTYTAESFAKNAEAYNLACGRVEDLDSSLFSVPSDVSFATLGG